jgi:hypothetical protein
MKSSSAPIPKEDKGLDLTATHDERPAHHRLHSHISKKHDHHERVPTTYPKQEGESYLHPYSEKSFAFYGKQPDSKKKEKKEKKPGCFGFKR